MRKARVLLADDHQILVDALQKVLEPRFEVVGRFDNGRELLKAAAALQPDVIVLDIGMPLLNGLDACRQLKRQMPRTKFIFLTFHEEPGLVMEAFRAGASGYVIKRSAVSELTEAIDRVLRGGGTFVSSAIAGDTMQSFARNPKQAAPDVELTARQREVLQLLAEGRAMKEVASILGIAVSTVADHKYHTMEMLQLKSNADLYKYAIENGIVS
ncbi:MAG: response regulator transcription factor [Candidatus Korobacteraceae bacterium]